MKKLCFIMVIVFAILTTATPVSAQDTEESFKFTIKTNPLAVLNGPINVLGFIPITGEYKVLFEAKVSEKSSIQLGLGYLGPSALLNLDKLANENSDISGIQTSGFRGQIMYKYFLSRDLSAPEGFYLGPHVSYASATIKNKDDENDKIEATKLNLDVLAGYQLITSGGFTLDIFMGMGLVIKNWDYPVNTDSPWDEEAFQDKSTVAVPIGFSFGYAF